MKTTKVLISGKVQKVFFRAYTKKTADKLNLKGWVRNLSNGKVEALFQGSEEKIEEMIKWCKIGSPVSKVDKVSVIEKTDQEEKEAQEFKSFEIKY